LKKILFAILKIVVPLSIGIFLIWLVFKDLKAKDIKDIKNAFHQINYFYLFLSVFFGILSHASRAWRWRYPLKHLGYYPNFFNCFFTVMIGYFANLGIPRSGEVMRCGILAKYENIPFNKLVGTVIAERVADLIILISFIISVVFLQFSSLENYLQGIGFFDKFSSTKMYISLGVLLVLCVITYLIIKKSQHKLFVLIRHFLSGIVEGLKSIFRMEDRWFFIGHTLFIWLMYFLMFYVTFFSLKDIESVPMVGIVTAFVIGGLSIATTNGGIGVYPLGIAKILVIYSVAFNIGYAFGWAVWVAQSLMIISLGLFSMIAIPRFNHLLKRKVVK